MHSRIFLFIIGTIFIAFTLLFLVLPRPAFSELERRELSPFPEFSLDALTSGDYTRDISAWFSDTEPMRDRFLALAMQVKSYMAFRSGDDRDNITFHASGESFDDEDSDGDNPEPLAEPADTLGSVPGETRPEIAEYDGHATPAAAAKMASSGVIVVGTGPETRALMAFGGKPTGGVKYAEAANLYKSTLGPDVNVYCMVIPLASEFYTPEKARRMTSPQLPVIRNIYSHLSPGVKGVDAYSALAAHADEPIYLRTDHHWAPLGAYYAAEAFAKAAGVDFLPLDNYDTHTIHNFVGTMYAFSKDIAVKNAPEDFVYYTPRGIDYNTTYVTLRLDSKFRVTGETAPFKGQFFRRQPQGSGNAYLTFMGGDYNQPVVRTSTANGRRLLIIKDSYGNALPGFLFGSFEELHVIDHRYFRHDVASYVARNHITDVMMVNNTFNAYSGAVAARYRYILTHSTPAPVDIPKPDTTASPQKTVSGTPGTDTVAKPVSTPDTTLSETSEPPAEIPEETPPVDTPVETPVDKPGEAGDCL